MKEETKNNNLTKF